MPARMIQNNFVSGIISPNLYGRSDLAAYYKGLADAENYVVGKVGSLRKRRGVSATTSLPDGFSSGNVRLLPYKYDRTQGGVVLVGTYSGTVGGSSFYGIAAVLLKKDLTVASDVAGVYPVDVGQAPSVASLQSTQIGDTLFVTSPTFMRRIVVSWAASGTSTVEVEEFSQIAKPSRVSSISAVPSAASSNKTYTYCAVVDVKGVRSDMSVVSCTYKNTWVAGDTIKVTVKIPYDLEFDSVIIGKKLGATYGEVARFYPEDVTATSGTQSFLFTDENISPGDEIARQTNVLGTSFSNPVCVGFFQQRQVFANASVSSSKTITFKTTTAKLWTDLPSDYKGFVRAYEKSSRADVSATVVRSWWMVSLPEEGRYRISYTDSSQTSSSIERDASAAEGLSVELPSDFSTLNTVEEWIGDGWEDVTDAASTQGPRITFPRANVEYCVEYVVLGSEEKLPMSLWFSEIGNMDNFYADRPVNDDDPFSPTILSPGPAFIRWLASYQDSLVCFTDCGIFEIRSDSTQNGFSSSTCKISLVDDTCVSETVRPISTSTGIVFVAADNKTVYSMAYDIQTDSKRPTNRMVLAEHLTQKSQVKSIALQSYPDSVVWCVLADGSILSFTHQVDQDVFAWSRHAVPGAKALEVVGLDTVTDGENGYTYGDLVFLFKLADGSVKLGRPVSGHEDVVGSARKPVAATFTTLRPESQEQTLAGRKKRVTDVLVRLHESGPLGVRPKDGGLPVQFVKFRGQAATASGDFKVVPRGYVDEAGQMTFVSEDANPSEVLAIVYDVEVAG